eukprot:TRINITY_DN6726_c0_g1_i3.p1 TRINITY_DN6726_c0_g1~~TRINITY_DN6726_c0_g1_i3.p1  ORF type:complete len:272 (-),score=73.04 TRINITY_DN6726_c0_g1_i3:646-1461(-)
MMTDDATVTFQQDEFDAFAKEASARVESLERFRDNDRFVQGAKPPAGLPTSGDLDVLLKQEAAKLASDTRIDKFMQACFYYHADEKGSADMLKVRALLHCLVGRAHNLTLTYSPVAEENLEKAVKLDPSLVEGWNALGECCWKKADYNASKFCFENGLNMGKQNKVSLRGLAMVLRQLGKDEAEKQANHKQSLIFAKQAVALDMDDGQSWYLYGNSLLTSFFVNTFDYSDLNNAMKAYQKAVPSAFTSTLNAHRKLKESTTRICTSTEHRC